MKRFFHNVIAQGGATSRRPAFGARFFGRGSRPAKSSPSLVIAAAIFLASSLHADEPKPISFKNDVMPVFFKEGCNAGDCHGSSRGQDGFVLSLFGYDPEGDYYRLIEEHPGRRIDLPTPENSLLLTKAIGAVVHTGGTLFEKDSDSYQIILDWIKQGARPDSADTPAPTGITFSSPEHKFAKPSETLQTVVHAAYTDGSTRDVTRWCEFTTSNESVASIDDKGFITTPKSGGAHVFARFDAFSVAKTITVLPEGDFSWSDPPENNYIDTLVFAKLQDMQIQPSDLCTDEQFIRRVTLDITGKLPTYDEHQSFIKSTDPDKRDQLVDQLLTRDSYAEMLAARWSEWLRIYTDTNPGSGTAPLAGWNYYQWILEQIQDNRPVNEFAHELITGNGSNLTNPASNYYTMLVQSSRIDPLRVSEDTAQIFMGIRTQCAQCHNHPFDRWTIDDYYAFQSFFMGVRRKHGSEAREYYTYVDIDAEPAKHLVDGRPMPHKFLGGDYPDVTDKDPREVLADWLTAEDNTLFREHMANRLWYIFFGKGIVEPVDDVRISNPPSNGPLMHELGRRFAEEYHYDQKRLIRAICTSRTYQLSVATNASNASDTRLFSHADLRRLRSDVLFDCLSQATDYQHPIRRSSATRAVNMFEGGRADTYNSFFFKTFGQARRENVCIDQDNTDANLSQALHLINGHTIDHTLTRNPKLVPYLMDKYTEPSDIIGEIYIRALSRLPSEKELAGILETFTDVAERDVNTQKKKYNNVIWALLNSSEFIFNH